MHFDYTTIGHVTIDVLADGTRQPGGAAFYSALQAARLGQRTQILTQGVPAEIGELLEPYREDLELEIVAAPATTTLATSGAGAARTQRLLQWAGPIAAEPVLDTTILHLAPVAREIPLPLHWRGASEFIGLTPQGLARGWSELGDEIRLSLSDPATTTLGACADGIVISKLERASCAALIAAARAAGAIVVVTDGPGPSTILLADGRSTSCPVPQIGDPVEDLGAGDVFAAALFIALSEGQDPEDAARFATAAAALRMGARGAAAIADRATIEARLRSIQG